jgi:hypothetical protein
MQVNPVMANEGPSARSIYTDLEEGRIEVQVKKKRLYYRET